MEQIRENPYLQYFIGLSGYQEETLYDVSTQVLFRKCISAEMLMEVNEYLLAHKDDDKRNTPPSEGYPGVNDTGVEDTNKGTLTSGTTCAPANIRYPQDVSWYGKHYNQAGRNAADFYRIICIYDKSFLDTEADRLCSFASVPIWGWI